MLELFVEVDDFLAGVLELADREGDNCTEDEKRGKGEEGGVCSCGLLELIV